MIRRHGIKHLHRCPILRSRCTSKRYIKQTSRPGLTMHTRSGKVLAQRNPPPRRTSPSKRRPLKPECTRMDVTSSDTGEGTHIRWVRGENPQENPPPVPATPDAQVDSRFVTPSPWIPKEPPQITPRALRETNHPGLFNRSNSKDDEPNLFLLELASRERFYEQYKRTVESAKVGRDEKRSRPIVGPTGTFIAGEGSTPTLGSRRRISRDAENSPPRQPSFQRTHLSASIESDYYQL